MQSLAGQVSKDNDGLNITGGCEVPGVDRVAQFLGEARTLFACVGETIQRMGAVYESRLPSKMITEALLHRMVIPWRITPNPDAHVGVGVFP